MAELARTFTKAALSRITAGSEGARLVGSALSGVTGSTVQAMLEGLKALVDGKLPSTSRGAAGGVGSLDENGKQPLSEINAAVLGGARRQGTWDASLGTAPAALANNDADRGKYWEVSVAGITLLGGKNDWNPGDWIIWEGLDWGWVDNTDRVGSVNGRTGAVTGLAEQNDARFTDARTPTDGSVAAPKMAADNKAIVVCTSTTRPASPVEGQHIYETDTDATLKNTGTPAAPVWSALGGGGSASAATELAAGVAELATQAETNAGTDDARIVTPLKLASRIAVGSFRAFQSTAQLDIASVTWTKVLFQTETWDASGWFDPATSRYTPQRAGIYALGACVGINPAVDAKYFTLTVYKNGVEYARMGQSHTGSAIAMLLAGGVEVVANGTTDYFEVYCQHNFGVNTSDLLADTTLTFFDGHYVGAAA